MFKILVIFVLFFSFHFISCSDNEEFRDQSKAPEDLKPAPTNLAASEIISLDALGFKKILDEHKGKTLFINTWATWCVPCKEEFPDLVQLADDYRDTDVVIIGISVDYPDEVETKIIPFLQKQNVNFPNYVQNFKKPEDLINLLNPDWRGAVPATFIYDKNGNQKVYMLGKHSFDEFKQKIESIRQEG